MTGLLRRGKDSARAYDAIKNGLTEHEYPPGKQIPVRIIAESLELSIKPVHKACRRLVAEHWLIEAHQADFFAWHPPEDNALPGLYGLSKTLLTFALENADTESAAKDRERAEIGTICKALTQEEHSAEELATYTGALFLAIFQLTGNQESQGYRKTREYIQGINERLYYLRTLECRYLEDAVSELVNLCELALAESHHELKQAIVAYYRRRSELLPKLPEMLATQ